MLKILVILLLVFGVVLFGLLFVVRFLKNTFSGMFTAGANHQTKKDKANDVIYNSEEVVVLKGEAKIKDEKTRHNDK